MTTKLSPIHPGEILVEEFMKPLGLNAHKLALALRVPANRIQAIVSGERGISGDTALRLARYFGVSPEFWMNLQASYEIRVARKEHKRGSKGKYSRGMRQARSAARTTGATTLDDQTHFHPAPPESHRNNPNESPLVTVYIRAHESRISAGIRNPGGRRIMAGKPIEMTELLKDAPKNWGRWGANDEIGCLNFLTSEEVLRGVRAVKQGKVFMLGVPVARPEGDPTHPLRSQPIHTLTRRRQYISGR